MNNRSRFAGTGSVLRFTLRQMLKSKSNLVSLFILFLFALLSLPISSITSGSASFMDTSAIRTAYICNESDWSIDYEQLKQDNAFLKDILFTDCEADWEYRSELSIDDIFVHISAADAKGLCSISSYTLEQTRIHTMDSDELLSALGDALNESRFGSEHFTQEDLAAALQDFSIDTFREKDYLAEEDSMGFDGNFVIQYAYSILVMVLCLISSSYIIRSVIEEKDSKLVELLMVSVQPLALLLGKILAIMTYTAMVIASMVAGFALSAVISTKLLHGPSLTDMLSGFGIDLSLMNVGWETILIVLVSLLLAFAAYALLAGLVGTCCSSMDEVESANMTVVLLVMAGYIVSCIAAAGGKGSVLAIVTSLLPVVSAFCAPVMYICANITLPVLLLSWCIQAVILLALAFFSARIYRSLLLYRGTRLKFRQLFAMFRSSRKEETV